MRRNVGIMGGTFNPIHMGHLLLAEAAREQCRLDEVLFIPCGNPYMKKTNILLSGEERAHMTALAIEGNPYFKLSRIEIERKGPTYTCDTLVGLRAKNPDSQFYFITGADSLFHLESWMSPEVIFENCIIVTAVRGEGTKAQIYSQANYLKTKYQAEVQILSTSHIDISSSEIRNKISKKESVRYMIPEKVLMYIQEKHFYQSIG